MDDYTLYQRLGEVIGELKGTNRRLDEIANAMVSQEKRISSLEESRASAKGSITGMRWLVHTAFVIASALGAEKIVQLTTGWHV